MLGAKLTQRFGATIMFRIVVGIYAMSPRSLMTFSPTATLMLTAQGLCGMAAAVIVPSLVALIANHYTGTQQATAIGALGLGTRRRQRRCLSHRRRARHLHRLAPGLRHPDRRCGHRLYPELQAQGGQTAA
jgi:hypothetical protein